MGLHILFHSFGSIMSVVISVLPLFWETEAGDEPSWDNTQRKKRKVNLPAAVRAATCARLWATGFIPPQACLSQYGGSWLLNGNTWPYASLLSRSDFTGLPSQHPPAVFDAGTPAPTRHPLLPLAILCPQSNLSSWILSEWHPLNLPNYLSSGHAALGCTFFSKGGAKSPKALQLDFLTSHQKCHALHDTLNPSLSSSKARGTDQRKIMLFWINVHEGENCIKNCLYGFEHVSNLALFTFILKCLAYF